jgi:hypothetical protein
MSTSAEGTPSGTPPESDQPASAVPAYHLLLDPEEVPVLRTALDLFIADASHGSHLRPLARAVLSRLPDDAESGAQAGGGVPPDGTEWPLSIPLAPGEMKIVHTSVHLLLDDLQREQADELHVLHQILDKLPDEHAIRAIVIE